MPRIKKRRVCKEPDFSRFGPSEKCGGGIIIMSVDEYETIRLIDKEGLNQEECADRMGIARTTAQLIYNNARRKLADCVTEGRVLHIEGGNYDICNGNAFCPNCLKTFDAISMMVERKEDNRMRIAVTYENGQIFQHFGHTEEFKLYDVEDGKVVSEQVVDTNGQGHGALGGFLAAAKADVLICGGIGGGAKNALAQAGVELMAGVSGSADAAVQAYLAGELVYSQDANCSHHDHEEGHSCGSGEAHSCGIGAGSSCGHGC